MNKPHFLQDHPITKNGFQYSRSCYKHIAGYLGVAITEAMETRSYLKKSDRVYSITDIGWEWFSQFDISENDFKKSRRPLTRQCIDGTERRPHLAGLLGDALLARMLQNQWFKKVESSRELIITPKGRQALRDYLGIDLN